MKVLYTDASFDSAHTAQTTEPFVRGKIAVSDGKEFQRVERVAVGKVPNLQQYINILELTAVARAVELACDMTDCDGFLHVYTDSMVAKAWATNGKVNPKVSTEAHVSALEYLRQARIKFGGGVTFYHILRDGNPAGWLLAKELKREAPHTI